MAVQSANITVDYTRVPGYPHESIAEDAINVIDKWLCDWNDRITLAKEILGGSQSTTVTLPHKYDAGDNPLNDVYARSVDIQSVGAAPGAAAGELYNKAELTIRYSTLDYDIDVPEGATVYVTEAIEPAAEFLTMQEEGLYWAAAVPLNPNEAPSMVVRMFDWVYTVHRASSVPADIWTYIGYVNSDYVTSRSLGLGFAPGCLMYGNPSLKREVTSEGATAWTITYRFTHRNNGTYASPKGWNYFPRSDDLDANNNVTFAKVYNSTTINDTYWVKPYPEASFSGIIV